MTLKTMFRIGILQAVVTFFMIVLGGLVHNTGSSLACPDWPTCFGTFFPKMEGGVLVEHSHRILGMLIGILCIVQVFLALRRRKQHRKIYLWALGLLVLVIFQGLLGGITVLWRLPPMVSTLHLGTSQLVFISFIAQAFRIRRTQRPLPAPSVRVPATGFILATLILIYVQILYGAAVRHFGYSAACGLGADYSVLCMNLQTGGTVFWPEIGGSQFHMVHRLLGLLSALFVIASTIPILVWAKRRAKLKTPRLLAGLSHLIVLAQILLGVWTVSSHVDTPPVTLHLAGATLLFGTFFFLHQYLSVLKCTVKKKA